MARIASEGAPAIFEYDRAETAYLASRDARLGTAIERIGHIEREVDTDLFSSVAHHIVGQQISTKAQQTVWARMQKALGEVTPDTLARASRDELQALGMTYRKADYLGDFARRVANGSFDVDAVRAMPDAEAIAALKSLKGVGTWTAEMVLLFCLQRPDVLSFDDVGIQRGMRMLYRHRAMSREQFERIRRRLSPCGSVASLYFWAISAGALPELSDPARPRTR